MKTQAEKRVATGIGIILCVVLIPVFIINVTIIVRSFVYPDMVPSFLGYKPFIVLSDSMNPMIESGDIVLVKQVETSTLKEGDIIAFREDDTIITHRIQKIIETDGIRQFVTKGDNNNTADIYPVSQDSVEGIYLLNVHKIGDIALFMQKPLGMILFVALPLIIFILYDIIRRWVYKNPDEDKTKKLEQELERMRQVVASLENDNSEHKTEEQQGVVIPLAAEPKAEENLEVGKPKVTVQYAVKEHVIAEPKVAAQCAVRKTVEAQEQSTSKASQPLKVSVSKKHVFKQQDLRRKY